MPKNLLPEFLELLAEADSVSGEVDGFDLDSSDHRQRRYWKGLLAEQRAACVALVELIARNPEEMLRQVREMGL